MQPILTSPRDTLTEAVVRRLIETAPAITVTAGLETVSSTGIVLSDISDQLATGSVSRNTYATIHGTCKLTIAGALTWGSVRVRPYMILSEDGTTNSARFNLGVYFLSTPKRVVGTDVEEYAVEGYDRLLALNVSPGKAYSADAGINPVTEVNRIITSEVGESGVLITPTSSTLPAAKVYPLDGKTTWLTIINDLLGTVGYRGLWTDWNGNYRSDPYVSPTSTASEWTYDADSSTTIVGEDRTIEADYFNAPNKWVFVRNNPAVGVADPTATGVYTVTNNSTGPTSVTSRGRTIPKVVMLDAVDDTALQKQGDAIVDTDRRIDTTYTLKTGPNPLHWHADVVTYSDLAVASSAAKCLVHEWSLPLDGTDMALTLRQV